MGRLSEHFGVPCARIAFLVMMMVVVRRITPPLREFAPQIPGARNVGKEGTRTAGRFGV